MSTPELDEFFWDNPDLMAVVATDGTFRVVNPAWHSVLGWDAGALANGQFVDLVHPDDRARTATEIQRLASGASGALTGFENRQRCHDGSYRWVEWSARARGDHVYATGRDVTRLKETEERLAENIVKSRAIFDTAVDSIVRIDRNLVIVEASRSSEEFFAQDLEGHGARNVIDIVHPDDRPLVLAAILRGFENDEVVNVRFRARHASGVWVMVESRGRALRDAEGRPDGAVIITRDVTRSVAAEAALEAARDEAEQANVAKSELLSRMSHELRTPLNSVLGFAQLLQMEPHSPDETDMIDYIHNSGRHLLDLINEVLDISRIESGNIAVTTHSVALDELVAECVGLVAPQASVSSIEIVDEVGPGLLVRADSQRLKQVLLNLLSNAIKYNRPHGTVRLRCERSGDTVRLLVTDTGHGIAPEHLDRLFTPFDRLDAESTGVEGTGLGLTLSKGLVEALGGTIGVRSTAGVGSTFWVELAEAHSTDLTQPGSTPASSRRETPGASLLYIEDNVASHRLIERLLRHRPDVRLITSLTASLGLELALQHRPTMVLLDVHLPDLSGFEVLERLRTDSRTASIPVVMLSADASSEQIRRFEEAGAREYLTKPLDLAKFLELLNHHLGRVTTPLGPEGGLSS